MARPKKNGTYLNVCIETGIYEKLAVFCEKSGQSKTIAVERALSEYFAMHEKQQELLRKLEAKDGQ